MKTVFVGMSGGVDSSVTAALLKEQGYNVVGVYMKNWTKDLPGFACPWKEDFQDAKRVAVQLGIDFKVYDFETQYRQKVVDYMVAEYQAGRTPNPDIMCNQEVKFKLFLNTALEDGADLIATGHYARVIKEPAVPKSEERSAKSEETKIAASPHSALLTPHSATLCVAANREKDQTYFLYRVTEDALAKGLMPIGEFKTKAEVRALAKKFGLATADKKDSQGICFVGKVGIREFLLHELGPQQPGAIIDELGHEIGQHDGAIFYTIGQRHGLNVGGGLPYYVTGKNMAKNEVYVTTNLQDDKLWHDTLTLADVHWINQEPSVPKSGERSAKSEETKIAAAPYSSLRTPHSAAKPLKVRTRYRASLVKIESLQKSGSKWLVKLADPVRAVTPGQSAVIYAGEHVLGGGIVV